MESSFLWLGVIVLVATTVTTGARLGTRYTLYSTKMSQPAATTFCKERGDHLLTFKTLAKLGSFQEIRKIWATDGKLTGDFWVSLMKNDSFPNNQYWHDGSPNTNNLGFTMENFDPAQLCYRFLVADNSEPIRDHACASEVYVICERDMGLCPFEMFAGNKIGETITRKDMGAMSVEACQNRCLAYDVTGEECTGIETDQSGLCYLLIGTKVFIASVTLQENPDFTLYVKRCFQMQEDGNPSLPVTFHLYDLKLNWDQSKTFCESNGQSMVKLDTKTKIDAFYVIFNQWYREGRIPGDSWSGLRDRGDSGTGDYIWTDEQPLASITNWAPGDEPNYMWIEFCVRLAIANPVWKTRECWRTFQVVCEEPAAECLYTDVLSVPEESPSVSQSGVTEEECQSKCRTTALGGEECTLYRYTPNNCDMYMGTVTLTQSSTPSKQKKCYFSEDNAHENTGIQYSFYNLRKTKAGAAAFCNNIGEEPLLLNTSANYNIFLEILQDRTDLPILDNIWITPASPASEPNCDVITTGVTLQSSTIPCDQTAQVVCLSMRGDCTYFEVSNTTLASSTFLPMSGRNVQDCKALCDVTKAGRQICAGIVHDGNVDCQLIMREDTYSNTPSDIVSENGKTLYYINCHEAVFLDRVTTSREYSVHSLGLLKSGADSFCTQIGATSLLPTTLPELSAVLDVISHWGDLGLLSESKYVWTGLSVETMGREYTPLESVEDNSGSDCVALNYQTSTWTPLTCSRQANVVCQKDQGSCMMEEYAGQALSVREGSMLFPAADVDACKTWCNDVSATYSECVAVEFDGTDCLVHFADSIYVTSTPAMTSSEPSTVFIRRCYTIVTPDATSLSSYNFVMFDTLLTHTESRDACSSLGLSMLNLDNETSPALSVIANRTSDIWLGLTSGLSQGHMWSDGQAVSWVNWQSGVPPGDQCVALDKTSPDLTWIGQDCSQTNFAMCNNGTGDCTYTSHPGKKLPSVVSGIALEISRNEESLCKADCMNVRVGTTMCRGVSFVDTKCYLDMGEDLYDTEPALVEDVAYNTFIRVCKATVTVEPYTTSSESSFISMSEKSTIDVSSLDETSSYIAETSSSAISTPDISSTDTLSALDETSIYVPETSTSSISTPDISTTDVLSPSDDLSLTLDDLETSSISTMQETSYTQFEPSGSIQASPTLEDSTLDTDTEWMGTVTSAQVFASSGDVAATGTEDLMATGVDGGSAVSLMSQYSSSNIVSSGVSGDNGGDGSDGSDGSDGGNGGRYVYQVCICRCRVQLPDTDVLMSLEVRGIYDALILNRRNLSSFLRTKMSVPNRKQSAIVMGSGLGISIMVTLLVFLFVLDFSNVLTIVKMCKNYNN